MLNGSAKNAQTSSTGWLITTLVSKRMDSILRALGGHRRAQKRWKDAPKKVAHDSGECPDEQDLKPRPDRIRMRPARLHDADGEKHPSRSQNRHEDRQVAGQEEIGKDWRERTDPEGRTHDGGPLERGSLRLLDSDSELPRKSAGPRWAITASGSCSPKTPPRTTAYGRGGKSARLCRRSHRNRWAAAFILGSRTPVAP